MIRAYEDKDIEALLEVWDHASLLATPFLEASFLEQERKNIREIYIPNTKTWVYEQNDKVVGFIAMIGNEVGAIFVDPQYHGTGLGAKLMNYVAELHDELDVDHSRLVRPPDRRGRTEAGEKGCQRTPTW